MDINRLGDLDCGLQVKLHDPSTMTAVMARKPAKNCKVTPLKIKI